jgi:DNA-binding response OmpR family regulator
MIRLLAERGEQAIPKATNALVIDDEDIFVGRSKAKLRTALVIHGEPLVARSLAMILGAEAFIVETASAGAEGVSLAQARTFDVIILGADLSDMSGLEAMSRLRLAEVASAVVFASVTPATAAKAAMLHLSDCT